MYNANISHCTTFLTVFIENHHNFIYFWPFEILKGSAMVLNDRQISIFPHPDLHQIHWIQKICRPVLMDFFLFHFNSFHVYSSISNQECGSFHTSYTNRPLTCAASSVWSGLASSSTKLHEPRKSAVKRINRLQGNFRLNVIVCKIKDPFS